ncbi:MAG TPA: hypothetical protein VEC12_01725 [Bacteroidia bacterium]|nr:hypothetical protein [Bacteroidia bacterium]
MKKFTVIILLILFTGVINSCKPDDNGKLKQTSFPVPQEVKDYMYFKPGTYWIYQDSATGDLDTVNVTDTVVASKTDDGNYYEHYETRTYSSFYKYYYYYKVNTSFSDRCITQNESRPCYNIVAVKTRPGNYVGESTLLYLPFQKNYWGYAYLTSEKSIVKMADRIPDLSIGNNSFNDVLIVNTTHSLFYSFAETNFFIAKNIGIVRKEIFETNGNKQIWNIISYNIHQ